MFCPKCGTTLTNGMCPRCTPMQQPQPQPQQFQQAMPQPMPAPQQFQQQAMPQPAQPAYAAPQPQVAGGATPQSAKKKRLIIIALILVAGMVLGILLTLLISGDPGKRAALDFAKRTIAEMKEESSWESNASVNMKYRIVASNKSQGLYVVEFHGSVRSDGETMKGGFFQIVGMGTSGSTIEYGDFAMWSDRNRNEALNLAKERISNY